MGKWLDKLLKPSKQPSYLRSVVAGSFYKMSDLRGNTSLADIQTQINTMRALARDSQVSTALSYYATDATTVNTNGEIIWATAVDDKCKEAAEIVNQLFKRWKLNAYARDHILELATIGNLYIPTTEMYKIDVGGSSKKVVVDNNTIISDDYDVVPSSKIPPEDIIHLWYQGHPKGYMMQPEDKASKFILYPESSIIHFSLGGLVGDYTIDTIDSQGNELTYDIQFAQPLMERCVQPTQTLSLLEDAVVLSSLSRVIKFINVECGGTEEEEIRSSLQQIKDAIEQQLSINTNTGDTQSYVNPQSPNNLIYLPRIKGQDAVSITDLNMAESSDADNKLLQYYQDKKLSVLGVPKEAMNFSSSEGLGNAGSVMSQRSALYANALQRLETSYIAGWTDALNKYFIAKGLSGYVDKFQLHMNPIVTEMSALAFDKRDSALNQSQTVIEILKELGVESRKEYVTALTELLSDVLPKTGASVSGWDIDVDESLSDEGDGIDVLK